MKKVFILVIPCIILFAYCSFSQNVGIGTAVPNASALLDITSTGKGLLIPRMTTSGITSVTIPAKGLLIYDSVKNQLMVNMGTPALPNWQTIVSKSGWNLTGNSGIDAVNNFVGTTDNNSLRFRVNNQPAGLIDSVNSLTFFGYGAGKNTTTGARNVAIGHGSLYANTIGSENTANGYYALRSNTTGYFNTANGYNALHSNTTGSVNTAHGAEALYSNTIGTNNTANGSSALYYNTTGNQNTATGSAALAYNTTGSSNTANGLFALYSNTTGNYNTANGEFALERNTTGSYNTANGASALYSNTNSSNNTANGYYALYFNTTGSYNTANGTYALLSNTTGSLNTANGTDALLSNTTGNYNTANGAFALYYNDIGWYNTAIGHEAFFSNTTGSYNTAVGRSALYFTNGSLYNTAIGYAAGYNHNLGYNNTLLGANSGVNGAGLFNCIVIGESATATASSQARIGNSSTTSIGGYANWSNISDGRIKKDIQENVPGLAFINKLKPVTYTLDLDAADKFTKMQDPNDKDGKIPARQASNEEIMGRSQKQQIIYSGFVAQDVEKAAKEINYDFSGVDAAKNNKDLYSLRYAEFVVPLVKAVQELSIQNDELLKRIEKLEFLLSLKK